MSIQSAKDEKKRLNLDYYVCSFAMVGCAVVTFDSIAQWKLKSRLKRPNKFVRNQVKKTMQSPTMRWDEKLKFKRIIHSFPMYAVNTKSQLCGHKIKMCVH